MALQNPQLLLQTFERALTLYNVSYPQIRHRLFAAGNDHTNRQPRGLPTRHHLVYVFSLSDAYGATCPAGPNRVLRVGKAASAGRLTQNYIRYDTAPGLAEKLATLRIFWPYLGLEDAGPRLVGPWESWIETHTDRDQFEVPCGNAEVLNLLEKYVRAMVGAVFEG